MKKGISLIVLVITIIVMIILAAAVVIAMNNNGIIDRAGQAVQLTDEKQVQDLAALAWAEAYLDETRTDTIEKVVKDTLADQGVTDDKWNIQVSDTGVVVTAKNNTAVEYITFTLLDAQYTVVKGTTWYEFVWNGEGKTLGLDLITNKEDHDGNFLAPSGLKIIIESTSEYVYYNDEIKAEVYILDLSNVGWQ